MNTFGFGGTPNDHEIVFYLDKYARFSSAKISCGVFEKQDQGILGISALQHNAETLQEGSGYGTSQDSELERLSQQAQGSMENSFSDEHEENITIPLTSTCCKSSMEDILDAQAIKARSSSTKPPASPVSTATLAATCHHQLDRQDKDCNTQQFQVDYLHQPIYSQIPTPSPQKTAERQQDIFLLNDNEDDSVTMSRLPHLNRDYLKEEQEYSPFCCNPRDGLGDRSRSRNKARAVKGDEKQQLTKRTKRFNLNLSNKEERPDKFMLKKIFTPLKKILTNERLAPLGIDLSEYFRARPNPKGGHRTPADIELLLWYVEEKYRNRTGIYRAFVQYLRDHRREIEEYGKASYNGRQHWEREYIHFLDFIFEATKIEGNSERRYRALFSHKPSVKSVENLQLLKSLFDPISMKAIRERSNNIDLN